jgi:hypothetical protein
VLPPPSQRPRRRQGLPRGQQIDPNLSTRKPRIVELDAGSPKRKRGATHLVTAENLDGALALAAELQEIDVTAAIEVRPVLEQELPGALEQVFRNGRLRILLRMPAIRPIAC